MMRLLIFILVLCAFVRVCASACAGTADDAEKIEFFESRIRPVLVEHCYSCHSAEAKDVKGGLLLDSRQAIMVGGDSGPALVPGDSKASLILDAMRHESLEMPPDRKLPDNIIDDFSTWIQNGAIDPRDGEIVRKKTAIDLGKGREFWSFRPVQRPPIPVTDVPWATTDIDRLIAAQQQAAEETGEAVTRAPLASPDVLIRRLTYVLTGLPPTLAEHEIFAIAWANDPDAAMEKTVDRLLESPQFGERWGRHWLDVARFSESTGGGRSLMLPDAWRFRDYVIQSFNADKPFDQLVREHISGDLLPSGSDEQHDEQLVGVGYLMLGAINYEEQDKEQLRMDVVDEQIDSMGRTFLGMTLGCCRCHDHKFDPIPTTDYYALAGIFRSTTSLLPNNVSDFVTAPLKVGYDKAAVDQWMAQDKALEEQIAGLKKSLPKGKRKAVVASNSLSRESLAGVIVDDTDATFEGTWVASSFQMPFIGNGYMHSNMPRTGLAVHYEAMLPNDGEYLVRMAISAAENRTDSVPVLITHADGESIVMVNQKVAPPGDSVFAELGRFRFDAASGAKVTIKASEATAGHVIADAIQFIEAGNSQLASSTTVDAPAATTQVENPKEAASVSDPEQKLKQLEEERAEHKKHKPEIPIAMCVRDEQKPADWHVHVRGEIRNLGAVVPRGFLSVATPLKRSATLSATEPASTSGRKELADWIATKDNPLTARVYVNRVWMHVMGEGIVRTPDNFGETGDRPTHPELLDYLADTFVAEDQWSTRKLVRRLCLTSQFRLSSDVSPEAGHADPENRLLARASRRRMDAESIRDSLLQISGALDLSIRSGRTIATLSTYDNAYHHDEHPMLCRSVYVPSFRNTMLDLFEVFDIANPNVVAGKRTNSLRPAQSLYMLNSPFVMEQSQKAAVQFMNSAAYHSDDVGHSIRNVWRICLGRDPSREEMTAALNMLNDRKDLQPAWATLFHGLFASVDFRYVD